ncbi:hypothetical protein DXT77_21915 [Pseudomonas sp. 91RF]|jgi:hypothetical protein|uniref:hypothetical protein n=1 Tax=Pseudomonas sp. 91RF TaxID=2292261 RepID=UPI000E66DFD5|nr:hypothetical protein [Pseudomonas sp. 91RF]RIJ08189.1 hypothetical protein DXT77_21915 [Pseudomonas sp. 91RF]
MDKNTICGVSVAALLIPFSTLLYLSTADIALSADAYNPNSGWLNGVPFQQTQAEIIENHYNECKNRYGPQLTREEAAQLDGACNPIVYSPEAIKKAQIKQLQDHIAALYEDNQKYIMMAQGQHSAELDQILEGNMQTIERLEQQLQQLQ